MPLVHSKESVNRILAVARPCAEKDEGEENKEEEEGEGEASECAFIIWTSMRGRRNDVWLGLTPTDFIADTQLLKRWRRCCERWYIRRRVHLVARIRALGPRR